MDRRVDPAKDFYLFANGGWLKRTRIPLRTKARGTFIEMQERTDAILFEILEECAAQATKGEVPVGSVRQLLGQFYASGMDKGQINMAGAAPLRPELDRIAQISDRKQLAEVLGYLHQHGVKALFEIGLKEDLEGAAIQFGTIDPGGLGMPPVYYLHAGSFYSFMRKRYVRHITRMFRLLGQPRIEAYRQAQEVLGFETELAKGFELLHSHWNFTMPAFATDLITIDHRFDWATYFKALGLRQDQLSWLDASRSFFIQRAIELVDTTPPDVLQAYLRWHLIRDGCAPFKRCFC
jgi:putative endopeptidase